MDKIIQLSLNVQLNKFPRVIHKGTAVTSLKGKANSGNSMCYSLANRSSGFFSMRSVLFIGEFLSGPVFIYIAVHCIQRRGTFKTAI